MVVQDLIITAVRVAFTLACGRVLVESRWTVSSGALTATSVTAKVHSVRAAEVVVALTATGSVIKVLVITAARHLDTVAVTGHWVERPTIIRTISDLTHPSPLSLNMWTLAFTSVWVQIQ